MDKRLSNAESKREYWHKKFLAEKLKNKKYLKSIMEFSEVVRGQIQLSRSLDKRNLEMRKMIQDRNDIIAKLSLSVDYSRRKSEEIRNQIPKFVFRQPLVIKTIHEIFQDKEPNKEQRIWEYLQRTTLCF
jgi:hypothetical protein